MPRGFVIRPLRESELPAALRLWAASEGIGLRPEESLESLERFLARNPGLSQAAFASSGGEETLAGCVLAGEDGRRGHLYHLAVAPERRGDGIGRSLCEAALKALASNGISRSAISVFASNDMGLKFWAACGWTLREDLKSFTFFNPPPGDRNP